MSSLLLKTRNNNSYLLSRKNKTILYVDNELTSLISNDKTENDRALDYASRFYNYLVSHDFFSNVDYRNRYKLNLNEEDVKRSLANTFQITFEVTQSCNLRCKYCGYGEFYNNFDPRDNIQMESKTARAFLDYMVEFLNSDYNISYKSPVELNFYGGEPLLNFTLIKELVDYSKKLNLCKNYFNFGMTTNALLLDKYMYFLVENGFNLLISLDGNYHNNQYRVKSNGESTFNRVVQNIEKLKNKYPRFFEKKVNFNAVLHDLNSLEEIYDFFKSKFGKKPNISELNVNGIIPERREDFYKLFKNVITSLSRSKKASIIQEELFDKMPNSLGALQFIQSQHNSIFKNFNEFFSKQENNQILTGTCLPFSRKIFLSSKGKILPCESVGQDFQLGSIVSQQIDLDFKTIAEYYSRLFNQYSGTCFKCAMKGNCLECLISKNKRNSNRCDRFLKEEDFKEIGGIRMEFLENNPRYIAELKKIVLK
jgi:uncharacterized protein